MFFTFKGVNSADMGLQIKSINNLSSPKRRYSEIDVYGRGKLSIDECTYENFNITIECLILGEDIEKKARDIKAWLQSEGGVYPLTISTEEDKVYPSIYKGVVDISEVVKYVNTVILTFDCKVGYTTGANNLIVLKDNGVIHNMGTIDSEPLIRVFGSGFVTIYINKIPINLDMNYTTCLVLDSELMNCTNELENANHFMIGDFPIFPVGDTEISWLGIVDRLEIIPRWRSL